MDTADNFISSALVIQSGDEARERYINLKWRWCQHALGGGNFGSVADAVIAPLGRLDNNPPAEEPEYRDKGQILLPENLEISKFILHVIGTTRPGEFAFLKLIIPADEGYVIRSDLLQERMRGSEFVREVSSFVKPLQHCQYRVSTDSGFDELAQAAIGGIWLDAKMRPLHQAINLLTADVVNRLSFPLLSPTLLTRKRLAIFGEMKEYERCDRFYLAAQALGVDIVVFDRPGHWLEDEGSPTSSLRSEFIPFDIKIDPDFPDRVVEAVRSYRAPIHGILTSWPPHLHLIACAAELLGLPTLPYHSVAAAANKFQTRIYDDSADSCAVVSSSEELDSILAGGKLTAGFPLIVKPCGGWDSLGVWKVRNREELCLAVQRTTSPKTSSEVAIDSGANICPETTVLIEPYCDGPEVDVNFVLLDGKVLFSEVVDNFPCPGDSSNDPVVDGFLEEQSMYPSALPADEIQKLQNSLHRTLLKMGFHSGVLHVEARVRNSNFEWRLGDNGHIDLLPKLQKPSSAPSVFLLEVNTRPAGYWDTVASAFTHGIDYYAQQILHAVGELGRFKSLAIHFQNGPQFICTPIPIMIPAGGILACDTSLAYLHSRFPGLMEHVIKYRALYRKGDLVPSPSATRKPYLAILILFSRRSREELFDVVKDFRRRIGDEITRVHV
ncbi:hypothetical protein PRK78_006835 [Emydomyces testavorans]|uniref:ATP-grasp domain-containing protein n=1 Tax=Emydomyces testavorans TaxID=2070801 RepID=A0AAF0IKW4_9EURO|nr:hypothetical protein PRK78_006835 [Emydomyces testavorans]